MCLEEREFEKVQLGIRGQNATRRLQFARTALHEPAGFLPYVVPMKYLCRR